MRFHRLNIFYKIFLVLVVLSSVLPVLVIADYPSSHMEDLETAIIGSSSIFDPDSTILPLSNPISDKSSKDYSGLYPISPVISPSGYREHDNCHDIGIIPSRGDMASLNNNSSFFEKETTLGIQSTNWDCSMCQYVEVNVDITDQDSDTTIDVDYWSGDRFSKNGYKLLGMRLIFNRLSLESDEKIEVYNEYNSLIGVIDSSMNTASGKVFISDDYKGKKLNLKLVPSLGPYHGRKFSISKIHAFIENTHDYEIFKRHITEKDINNGEDDFFYPIYFQDETLSMSLFFSSLNLIPGDHLRIYDNYMRRKYDLDSGMNTDRIYITDFITGNIVFLKLLKAPENKGKGDSTFSIYRIDYKQGYNSPKPDPDPITISINSIPSGATVYVNTVLKGTTPLVISDIPAGNHTFSIKKIGYITWTDNIALSEGETTSINASLVPIEKTGFIYDLSNPAGAEIFIDGITTGKKTNSFIPDVPVGYHTVLFNKTGYRDSYKTASVSQGIPVTVRAFLIPV